MFVLLKNYIFEKQDYSKYL